MAARHISSFSPAQSSEPAHGLSADRPKWGRRGSWGNFRLFSKYLERPLTLIFSMAIESNTHLPQYSPQAIPKQKEMHKKGF